MSRLIAGWLVLSGVVFAQGPRDLVLVQNAGRASVRTVEGTGALVSYVGPEGVVAEATAAEQAALAAAGFEVTVITPAITDRYEAQFRAGCDFGQYLTYEAFVDSMQTIATSNPGICRLETLGTSFGGRLLLALRLSDNPQLHENEPAVHFEGAIHGDEKIAWAVSFEMVKYLLSRYGSDTLATRLVNTREIWLLPMYNPDGYVAARRYNGNNVDLNRNWGWMWGGETAQGASAFSEPENRAVLAHIMRHPMVLFVSFHAGTEYISFPWSYSPDSAPEKPLLSFLSQRYSVPNGYEYGQGYQGMYPINGSTKDFDYGSCGMMGWSIEVHMQKTPPASEIDPTFNRNRAAMLEFFHRAGQGIHGTVTDAATGLPVHCQVWVGPANWPSYNSPELGDFHRFCLPGTYSVTFRAPGYRDTTVAGVVVPNSGDSSVTLSVQMTASEAVPLFAYRLVWCSYVNETANHTYPVRALGPSDGVPFQLDNTKTICLDMDRPVRNGNGTDLVVYRSSGTGTASVQGANSWQGPWTNIGTANSVQSGFDLGSVGLDSVRFVRLTATGTFYLDAVEGVNLTGVQGSEEVNMARAAASLVCRRLVLPVSSAELPFVLFDHTGRRVAELVSGENDLNRLSPGVYFLRQASSTSRLVVVR
jgi:hypothetical protein